MRVRGRRLGCRAGGLSGRLPGRARLAWGLALLAVLALAVWVMAAWVASVLFPPNPYLEGDMVMGPAGLGEGGDGGAQCLNWATGGISPTT